MSFSCSFPPTLPADVGERLDGLQPSPPITSDLGKAAFEDAKEAFESIAAGINSGEFNIGGSISGHFYDGASFRQNSITVSVNETTLLTPEQEKEEAEKAAAAAETDGSQNEGSVNGAPDEGSAPETPAEESPADGA